MTLVISSPSFYGHKLWEKWTHGKSITPNEKANPSEGFEIWIKRKRIEKDRMLIIEMIDASFELAKKRGVMILNLAVTALHASINENELWKMPERMTNGSTLFDILLLPTLTVGTRRQ